MDENRFLVPKAILYILLLAWFCGLLSIPKTTAEEPKKDADELGVAMQKYCDVSTPSVSITPQSSYTPAIINEPNPVSPIEQEQKSAVTVTRIGDTSSTYNGKVWVSYGKMNFFVSYSRSEEETFDRDTGAPHMRIIYKLTDQSGFPIEFSIGDGVFKVSEIGYIETKKDSVFKSLISNKTESGIMTILEAIYQKIRLTENYLTPPPSPPSSPSWILVD